MKNTWSVGAAQVLRKYTADVDPTITSNPVSQEESGYKDFHLFVSTAFKHLRILSRRLKARALVK